MVIAMQRSAKEEDHVDRVDVVTRVGHHKVDWRSGF